MVRIKIETNNAAFGEDPAPEVARILRKAAQDIEEHGIDAAGSLFDINGNKVGTLDIDSGAVCPSCGAVIDI